MPGIGGSFTRFGMVEVLYVTEFIGLSLILAGYLVIKRDRSAAFTRHRPSRYLSTPPVAMAPRWRSDALFLPETPDSMTARLLLASGALVLSACTSTAPTEAPVQSASVSPTEARTDTPAMVTVGAMSDGPALSVTEALAQSRVLDGQTVRVAGTIQQVCQAKGCWLTFATDQGETLRVMTHEEGQDENEEIVFPMDASGRRAEVVGTLRVAEESVARRRHLAEDAGASDDEIAAITEPSRAVTLFATGARIATR